VLPAAAIALAGTWILNVRGYRRLWRIVLPLVTVFCCYVLVVALPNQWDTMSLPTVTTYFRLPLRPLLLRLRALGTLGLPGLLCF
jgi:hypothetical protein